MAGIGSLVRYWIPVGLWITLIFIASTDVMASRHTSTLIGPVLRWFWPGISNDAIDCVQFAFRKAAHLSEYSVLALLVWRALRRPVPADARPWSWREARIVLFVTACYAASDEWHQTFVPSREGRVLDVGIDTLGAALGLGLLWCLGRWRKHW